MVLEKGNCSLINFLGSALDILNKYSGRCLEQSAYLAAPHRGESLLALEEKMLNIQFSFKIRQAMQVAYSVATKIHSQVTELSYGTELKRILNTQVLLKIKEHKDGATFRFEGGTVVRVHMHDCGPENRVSYNDPLIEDWWVVSVDIRYYSRLAHHQGEDVGKKSSGCFGFTALKKLRDSEFGWYHPHVLNKSELEEAE